MPHRPHERKPAAAAAAAPFDLDVPGPSFPGRRQASEYGEAERRTHAAGHNEDVVAVEQRRALERPPVGALDRQRDAAVGLQRRPARDGGQARGAAAPRAGDEEQPAVSAGQRGDGEGVAAPAGGGVAGPAGGRAAERRAAQVDVLPRLEGARVPPRGQRHRDADQVRAGQEVDGPAERPRAAAPEQLVEDARREHLHDVFADVVRVQEKQRDHERAEHHVARVEQPVVPMRHDAGRRQNQHQDRSTGAHTCSDVHVLYTGRKEVRLHQEICVKACMKG